MRLLQTLLLLSLLATIGVAQDEQRPNVVLIVVDDLGWGDLSCYGNEFIETPRIDALADAGVRFTQAYSASAVCSPSRAALLTGRAPARIGLTDYWGPTDRSTDTGRALVTPASLDALPHSERTLAELLQAAGYTTAHIGKWHLGTSLPTEHGFDVNIGGTERGRPPTYFDPYVYRGTTVGIETLPGRKPGEYLTDREADEAVTFLSDNRAQPFFLQLAHHAVHKPVEVKDELFDYYQAKRAKAVRAVEASTTVGLTDGIAEYAAMVTSVDQAVGRVVDRLEELGLSERTLVIVTSDNGGLVGPTNTSSLRGGKGGPYENGLRVPLIIAWPGRVSSAVNEAPVSLLDIVPTVLAKVGVEAESELDGSDLSPLLAHQEAGEPRTLVWHYPHYYRDFGPHSVLRRGTLKLVRWYESERRELYDLQSDPAEAIDLAQRSPRLVSELDQALTKRLDELGAQRPVER